MWATFWNSWHEMGSGRAVAVLVGIALVTAFLITRIVSLGTASNGVNVVYFGTQPMGPWPVGVPTALGRTTSMVGALWFLLTVFGAAPLLTATLDRGWLELTFAKATPRWRILMGRFLCGTSLYLIMLFSATVPLAVWLWWKTGIPTWHLSVALLIETFSFASVLAVAALCSLTQKGVALPIMASFALQTLSPVLAQRQILFYETITAEWARRALDWLYYILPKNSELDGLAASYIRYAAISSSWALWTTGVFTLVTLGVTLWLLERKSF